MPSYASQAQSVGCMDGVACEREGIPPHFRLGHEDPVSHFKWITKKNDEGDSEGNCGGNLLRCCQSLPRNVEDIL